VREALNTLPAKQLKILELAYFSGYTHVEIAERLNLPLSTVKGRMRLGLRKLRNHFEARGLRERGSHRPSTPGTTDANASWQHIP
jgi:RNA polymerase sigma-70 factor (ECF subfamily)